MSESTIKTAEQLKTAAGGSVQSQTKPALAQAVVESPTPTMTEVKPASPDLNKMLLDLVELQQKVAKGEAKAAAKAAAVVPKEIDWTKITESDITNFDLNIPVIEQQMPSYMDVHLEDLNFISRWIHVLPTRLGPCLAQGYSYVQESDLDKRFPHPLNFDASGHYSCGDVVCLKIQKSRYYPALKANYVKTMAIHGRAQMMAKLGQGINKDDKLAQEIHKGGMSLYEPTDMKGTDFSQDLFSSSL